MAKLGFVTKLSYALGQVGWSIKDTLFQTFLFFFYTHHLGLAPGLAGTAALLALISDALSDPVVGQVSDNWKSKKWGRRHGFMLFGSVPTAACIYLLFVPPEGLSQVGLFLWFLVFAVLTRAFITFFAIPHFSLGAELSPDYQERLSISSYRSLAGYGGAMTIQIIAWFFILPPYLEADNAAPGFGLLAAVAAGILLISLLLCVFGTRHRIPYLPAVAAHTEKSRWYYAFSNILGALKDENYAVFMRMVLLYAVLGGVGLTLTVHVNTFIFRFSPEQTGGLMVVITLALLPAAVLSGWVTRRFGKEACMYLVLLAAILNCIPIIATLYGIFPEPGSRRLVYAVYTFTFFANVCTIAATIMTGAMVPDIIDTAELRSGRRQEGIYTAGFSFVLKLSFGIGSFFSGLIVDFAGIQSGMDAQQVSRDMLMRLGTAKVVCLMTLASAAFWVFQRYNLTEARHREVKAELAVRGGGLEVFRQAFAALPEKDINGGGSRAT